MWQSQFLAAVLRLMHWKNHNCLCWHEPYHARFCAWSDGPATKTSVKTTPDNKKTRRPAKAQGGGNK
jgi:hypothetical protein